MEPEPGMAADPVVVSSLAVAAVYVVVVLPEHELHSPRRLLVVTTPSLILSLLVLLTDSVPSSALGGAMIPLFTFYFRSRDLGARLEATSKDLSGQIEEFMKQSKAAEDKIATLFETTMKSS